MSVGNLCHLCCYVITIEKQLAKISQPLLQQPESGNTNKLIIHLIYVLFSRRELIEANQVNTEIIAGETALLQRATY